MARRDTISSRLEQLTDEVELSLITGLPVRFYRKFLLHLRRIIQRAQLSSECGKLLECGGAWLTESSIADHVRWLSLDEGCCYRMERLDGNSACARLDLRHATDSSIYHHLTAIGFSLACAFTVISGEKLTAQRFNAVWSISRANAHTYQARASTAKREHFATEPIATIRPIRPVVMISCYSVIKLSPVYARSTIVQKGYSFDIFQKFPSIRVNGRDGEPGRALSRITVEISDKTFRFVR